MVNQKKLGKILTILNFNETTPINSKIQDCQNFSESENCESIGLNDAEFEEAACSDESLCQEDKLQLKKILHTLKSAVDYH